MCLVLMQGDCGLAEDFNTSVFLCGFTRANTEAAVWVHSAASRGVFAWMWLPGPPSAAAGPSPAELLALQSCPWLKSCVGRASCIAGAKATENSSIPRPPHFHL